MSEGKRIPKGVSILPDGKVLVPVDGASMFEAVQALIDADLWPKDGIVYRRQGQHVYPVRASINGEGGISISVDDDTAAIIEEHAVDPDLI